jgi:hypothetical protein
VRVLHVPLARRRGDGVTALHGEPLAQLCQISDIEARTPVTNNSVLTHSRFVGCYVSRTVAIALDQLGRNGGKERNRIRNVRCDL